MESITQDIDECIKYLCFAKRMIDAVENGGDIDKYMEGFASNMKPVSPLAIDIMIKTCLMIDEWAVERRTMTENKAKA